MHTNVKKSLEDLLGSEYVNSVKECALTFFGMEKDTADKLGSEKVEFMDEKTVEINRELLEKVGTAIFKKINNNCPGATTNAFRGAANNLAAPVGGSGCFRVGEDGRIYLISKSEHYQSCLGHNFGGYRLINNARMLGILNATHNNTRGHIVRLLEHELIRTINGLDKNDSKKLEAVLGSNQPKVLNRVLNLETGSLACEAAIKMMLTRFYKLDSNNAERKYQGKTPVFLVMGDNEGGVQANYHGTTIIAQIMRGLWPEVREKYQEQGICEIVPVNINDIRDFKTKIERYNQGRYKTAGFLHEIILMNYGAIQLEKEYLKKAYELCSEYDTPTMADEIQSCMWYKGIYLFRQYDIAPDFVILGKGFSGGEYPSSRVITTAEMDNLSQFGALVTNGQGELSSLAYLITMEFVLENGDEIDRMGTYIETRFKEMTELFPDIIQKIEGKGHLLAIHFKDGDKVKQVVKELNRQCIDISAQTYKANCPPAALIKLPLIVTEQVVDFLYQKAVRAIQTIDVKRG